MWSRGRIAARTSLVVIAWSSIALADDPTPTTSLPPLVITSPGSAEPASAAPPPPPDQPSNEIVLQDGRVIRGRVTSLLPGEHVIIEASDGQQTLVPWREIARADGPSFPGGFRAYMPVPTATHGAIPRPVEIRDPGEGRVPLHIEADQQVIIGLPDVEWFRGFQRVGIEGREVCRTPCTLYVPRRSVRLTAETRTSRTDYVVINMDPMGTRALLTAPSPALGAARMALQWGGFAIFAAGGGTALAGFASSNTTVEYAGITVLSVGAVCFLTSFILSQVNRVNLRATYPLPAVESTSIEPGRDTEVPR